MPIVERRGRFYVTVGSGQDRFRTSTKSLKQAELFERRELTKRGLLPAGEGSQVVTTPSTGKVAHLGRDTVNMQSLLRLARKTVWADAKSGVKLAQAASLIVDMIGPLKHPKEVTAAVLRDVAVKMVEQGNSGSTVNRKLSAVSMLLRLAEEDGHIESRPKLPRRRESEHRIRFLSTAEEQKILAYCDHIGAEDLSDFIQCAIDTGFRRSELLTFRVSKFYNGMLHLEHGETKTDKGRAVPATSRVQAIIEKRKALGYTYLFQGFTEAILRRHWDLLRGAMGMLEDPQFVVHMLRHTCASRLAMAGKNAAFIKQWMGHTTILTTERYMHLAPETLRAGVGALEGFVPAVANVAQ